MSDSMSTSEILAKEYPGLTSLERIKVLDDVDDWIDSEEYDHSRAVLRDSFVSAVRQELKGKGEEFLSILFALDIAAEYFRGSFHEVDGTHPLVAAMDTGDPGAQNTVDEYLDLIESIRSGVLETRESLGVIWLPDIVRRSADEVIAKRGKEKLRSL